MLQFLLGALLEGLVWFQSGRWRAFALSVLLLVIVFVLTLAMRS